MSATPVKRKLAAILAADAVGYSRMMAADEEGTMKILSAHRSVIDGIIQFHEGRIINTAGDSVLAEFASPTQAVRCAVEIQDALKTRNDSLPDERRMHFRIGVNLGDVMVKGEDLLGDGVNVAARLEGIAEPGEIYLSSSVYDQIAGKLDLGFVDMGEQSLKNIERPVRAYRVDRGGARAKAKARKSRAPIAPWIAAGLAVAALGAGGAWYFAEQSRARDDQAKAAAGAELAKARAEAEEAKKTAAAAAASAQAAKRELEEQRLVESRARAQAELAAARAEAEATRRKAQAELVSAAEARRAAEAAAKAAASRAQAEAARQREAQAALASAQTRDAGDAAARTAEAQRATEAAARAAEAQRAAEAANAQRAAQTASAAPAPAPLKKWNGNLSCSSIGSQPAAEFKVAATAVGDAFKLTSGRPGKPGSLVMSGTRAADGRLRLAGTGISARPGARGRPYSASVDGKFSGERYEGSGTLGRRVCWLTLLPETAAASVAWAGMFTCDRIGSLQPGSFGASVSAKGQAFEVGVGRPGEPGSLQLSGTREADGRLLLSGSGISGLEEFRGKGYAASIDGRFSGDRFQGRGKLGARDCALTIARK